MHPREHVELVRETSAAGAAFDLDTPTSPGTWEAALHAAGAGCAMVDALLSGEAPTAFCALRPPGHHAEPSRAMGFCMFSNAAIAARYALGSGISRVLVLDWDVHHGNGTNAALHDSADALFVSLHRYPFYPGTGPLSDVGSGEGTGFSLNLPLPGGSGEEEWLSLMEHVVAPVAAQFRPELVLVCAGYDAHRDDPLGGCALENSSFGELGRWSRLLGERVGAPVGCLLEGGYDLDALSGSVAATMEALTDVAPSRGRFPRGRWWTGRPSRSAASGRSDPYFRAPTITTSFASPARSATSGSRVPTCSIPVCLARARAGSSEPLAYWTANSPTPPGALVTSPILNPFCARPRAYFLAAPAVGTPLSTATGPRLASASAAFAGGSPSVSVFGSVSVVVVRSVVVRSVVSGAVVAVRSRASRWLAGPLATSWSASSEAA